MTAVAAEPVGGALVSIVLPTYNGAKYLRQSIESCLGQTHRNLELIVVDDASTDETPAIIKACADSDPRLVTIRNEHNLKLPASLNVGFGRARGEFLTWTSDDNYYDPRAIEKMLAFLHEHQGHFVYCDYYRLDAERPSEQQLMTLPEVQDFAVENHVGACFLYSKRVQQEVGGYDEALFLVEDYDYWMRVAKKFQLLHMAEPLYYYRCHQDSLSFRMLRNREMLIARSLVHLKNHVTEPQAEAELLIKTIAKTWAGAEHRPLARAAIRIIGAASLGSLTPYRLHRLVGLLLTDWRIRRLLRRFAQGGLAPDLVRARLQSFFGERGGGREPGFGGEAGS